jgi:RNA 3'-terminal phosphate cyclase (ATP)
VIHIDGSSGEGGGQILRTALALSAVTAQPFEITRIRERRPVPGLRPQHVASVRAAAMVSGAKVGGAFDGSPELRFEPGTITPGDFRFEIATAGATTLVLQTVLLPLATAGAPSTVAVTGGTHVPAAPSFHYFARHWCAAVAGFGLKVSAELVRAGFYPPGGGEVKAAVQPWTRPDAPRRLEERGPLSSIRGLSGSARLKGGVAQRQADAARSRLWEARRLESAWEIVEVPAASPGSFLLLEAVFENTRAAFGFLGEKGLRSEVLGDRAARVLLRFLENEGAVDEHLADQLALPLALSGRGGRVTTDAVTAHLQTVAGVLGQFGFGARTFGRPGGPGGLEVDPR